jgi:hypothetical protein
MNQFSRELGHTFQQLNEVHSEPQVNIQARFIFKAGIG